MTRRRHRRKTISATSSTRIVLDRPPRRGVPHCGRRHRARQIDVAHPRTIVSSTTITLIATPRTPLWKISGGDDSAVAAIEPADPGPAEIMGQRRRRADGRRRRASRPAADATYRRRFRRRAGGDGLARFCRRGSLTGTLAGESPCLDACRIGPRRPRSLSASTTAEGARAARPQRNRRSLVRPVARSLGSGLTDDLAHVHAHKGRRRAWHVASVLKVASAARAFSSPSKSQKGVLDEVALQERGAQ